MNFRISALKYFEDTKTTIENRTDFELFLFQFFFFFLDERWRGEDVILYSRCRGNWSISFCCRPLSNRGTFNFTWLHITVSFLLYRREGTRGFSPISSPLPVKINWKDYHRLWLSFLLRCIWFLTRESVPIFISLDSRSEWRRMKEEKKKIVREWYKKFIQVGWH